MVPGPARHGVRHWKSGVVINARRIWLSLLMLRERAKDGGFLGGQARLNTWIVQVERVYPRRSSFFLCSYKPNFYVQ